VTDLNLPFTFAAVAVAATATVVATVLLYAVRRRRRTETPVEQVAVITTAGEALSTEQRRRTRRYLISMGIRTGCVLAAIVVPGWPRWVLIAAAVALPYLAVVAANSSTPKKTRTPQAPDVPPRTREITR